MIANRRKLEIAMAAACMSSADLQDKSGLPRGTYLNVITGRSVRPVTIGKIARALKVPVESLIDTEEGKQAERW